MASGARVSSRAAMVAARMTEGGHVMSKASISRTHQQESRPHQGHRQAKGSRQDRQHASRREQAGAAHRHAQAAGRRNHRRDGQGARLAAAHRARRHRRCAQEEARAKRSSPRRSTRRADAYTASPSSIRPILASRWSRQGVTAGFLFSDWWLPAARLRLASMARNVGYLQIVK